MPVKVGLKHATSSHTEESREYELTYWVKLENKDQGPLAAILATGWTRNSPYQLSEVEFDLGAKCIGIDANPVDEANFLDYEVVVRFGKPTVDPASNPEDPLATPVEESWTYSSAEIPMAVDLLGNPLVNTAGDIYEKSFRGNIPAFTFTRNEPNLNRALFVSCRNAVNAAPWKGFPAFTVKVANISANSAYGPNGKYYRIQYQFETNPDTFRFRPLNAGKTQIAPDAAGLLRRQNCLVGGSEDPVECPLDMAGKSLRDPTTGALLGAPFLREFVVYPEVDFDALFPFL